MSQDWETVTPDTSRLRVPGGWLEASTTVTFVPDPPVVADASMNDDDEYDASLYLNR